MKIRVKKIADVHCDGRVWMVMLPNSHRWYRWLYLHTFDEACAAVRGRCERGHETKVKIHHAVVKDGVVKSGYMGSSADWCDVCDEPIVAVLGASTDETKHDER